MHRTAHILVFIFLITIFFRFWMLNTSPPGLYPDEAMNGNNALFVLKTGNFDSFYPENNGREGLFINLTAGSIWFFGNQPWAIRLISALFGSLTVLGMFFFGRKLFSGFGGNHQIRGLYINEIIALSASFFMSVSFWHINFSRIGFRAIMAPFFLVWSLYFLWLVFKENISDRKKMLFSALGGFLFGLGAHSYIAYRIAPVLLIIPFYNAVKAKTSAITESSAVLMSKINWRHIFVFLFFAIVAFAPLGIYYLQNPADFLGRTSQLSIFSEQNPIRSFFLNSVKTFGAFWFTGDFNPRHNFPGASLLWRPVGILFAIGLFASFRKLLKNSSFLFLWIWILIFSIPAVFSSEGLPHALRSLLMLPAIMYIAAFGLWKVIERVILWIEKKEKSFPEKLRQLKRIRFEFMILLSVFLTSHIMITYSDYFLRWTNMPNTQAAFNADYADKGKWLNDMPPDIKKYVIVNAGGVLVASPDKINSEPLPMPAQTIMFLTDTWPESQRALKNIRYILPENLADIDCVSSCVIVPLERPSEINLKIRSSDLDDIKFSVKPGFGIFYKGIEI